LFKCDTLPSPCSSTHIINIVEHVCVWVKK
jgi:hypothetical protein